ncbi:MAG: transketolase [Candidatus Neomarinimicrobiota bacterium]
MTTHNKSPELGKLAANTIRLLAADGVQKAGCGHPGMPMGMADCAFVLWNRFLKFNSSDPKWVGRDRFILSPGHGSMLLYSLLHLSGYSVSIDDLKNFRQWDSPTPGHPEYGCLPGIETTTGPLGQGFSTGVGMAIAAKMTAERFNREGFELFGTHRIFGIVSDGDLMEGVSSEAASLAAHLGLDNIVYIYDDNKITIEGKTDLAFTENVGKRFEAYGWKVLYTDGHDQQSIAEALANGIAEKERPTLIIARTHIGFGSPNKQDNSEVHGAALGVEELRATKKNLGFPEDAEFVVSDEIKTVFAERNRELKAGYDDWKKKFVAWQASFPELANEWENRDRIVVTEEFEKELVALVANEAAATRSLSGKVMQIIADKFPGFCGGSADLAPSTSTYLKAFPDIQKGKFGGRNFHFGIREHAMGAILTGMSLEGGLIPFGATFLVFSDYMKPAIRLAAMMGRHVVYVFTHDTIFLGEDGPTHQPTEQLPALRSIPNLTVIRPADGTEVAMAWSSALKKQSGPTALILTRQKVTPVRRDETFDPLLIQKGAYILSKEGGDCTDVTLVATGSEVQVAQQAKELLEKDGLLIRVVSMPSVCQFKQQPDEYRSAVIPPNSPVAVIEAASSFGWGDLFRQPLLTIGIDRFGASAPQKVLAEQFGFTPEKVAEKIRTWLQTFD